MDLQRLEQKLLKEARDNPPGDKVPYAFEKRILARISELRLPDYSALWARALWRAVVPCTAVMLLLSAWSFFGPANPAASDFSQELENTVLAAAEQEQSSD